MPKHRKTHGLFLSFQNTSPSSNSDSQDDLPSHKQCFQQPVYRYFLFELPGRSVPLEHDAFEKRGSYLLHSGQMTSADLRNVPQPSGRCDAGIKSDKAA